MVLIAGKLKKSSLSYQKVFWELLTNVLSFEAIKTISKEICILLKVCPLKAKTVTRMLTLWRKKTPQRWLTLFLSVIHWKASVLSIKLHTELEWLRGIIRCYQITAWDENILSVHSEPLRPKMLVQITALPMQSEEGEMIFTFCVWIWPLKAAGAGWARAISPVSKWGRRNAGNNIWWVEVFSSKNSTLQSFWHVGTFQGVYCDTAVCPLKRKQRKGIALGGVH